MACSSEAMAPSLPSPRDLGNVMTVSRLSRKRSWPSTYHNVAKQSLDEQNFEGEDFFEEGLAQDNKENIRRSLSWSKKKMSIGEITTSFVEHCQNSWTDSKTGRCHIALDLAAHRMGIERRRLYDIVNVLATIGLVVREEKHKYRWRAPAEVVHTLAELQREAADTASSAPAAPAAAAGPLGRRTTGHSLAKLSRAFVQLFLVAGPGAPPLTVRDAAAALGRHPAPAAAAAEGEGEGGGAAAALGPPPPPPRAQPRRLYDVANILVAIGLISKDTLGKNPDFTWKGPDPSTLHYALEDSNNAELLSLGSSGDRFPWSLAADRSRHEEEEDEGEERRGAAGGGPGPPSPAAARPASAPALFWPGGGERAEQGGRGGAAGAKRRRGPTRARSVEGLGQGERPAGEAGAGGAPGRGGARVALAPSPLLFGEDDDAAPRVPTPLPEEDRRRAPGRLVPKDEEGPLSAEKPRGGRCLEGAGLGPQPGGGAEKKIAVLIASPTPQRPKAAAAAGLGSGVNQTPTRLDLETKMGNLLASARRHAPHPQAAGSPGGAFRLARGKRWPVLKEAQRQRIDSSSAHHLEDVGMYRLENTVEDEGTSPNDRQGRPTFTVAFGDRGSHTHLHPTAALYNDDHSNDETHHHATPAAQANVYSIKSTPRCEDVIALSRTRKPSTSSAQTGRKTSCPLVTPSPLFNLGAQQMEPISPQRMRKLQMSRVQEYMDKYTDSYNKWHAARGMQKFSPPPEPAMAELAAAAADGSGSRGGRGLAPGAKGSEVEDAAVDLFREEWCHQEELPATEEQPTAAGKYGGQGQSAQSERGVGADDEPGGGGRSGYANLIREERAQASGRERLAQAKRAGQYYPRHDFSGETMTTATVVESTRHHRHSSLSQQQPSQNRSTGSSINVVVHRNHHYDDLGTYHQSSAAHESPGRAVSPLMTTAPRYQNQCSLAADQVIIDSDTMCHQKSGAAPDLVHDDHSTSLAMPSNAVSGLVSPPNGGSGFVSPPSIPTPSKYTGVLSGTLGQWASPPSAGLSPGSAVRRAAGYMSYAGGGRWRPGYAGVKAKDLSPRSAVRASYYMPARVSTWHPDCAKPNEAEDALKNKTP